MKAVFLDAGSFPAHIKTNLPEGIANWIPFDMTEPHQCLERIADADIVLTNKVVLTADTIAQLQHTKLICVTATGTNNVALPACKSRGIQVVNATGYGTNSVTEHTLMLMLALARGLPTYLASNDNKSWSDSRYFCDFQAPIKQLYGRTLTIVGAGTLGTAVAELGKAFGMKVILAEHAGINEVRDGYCEFRKALAQADVISIHCPLTETTKNLFNAHTLSYCKPDAILINTGRGGIVQEQDLLDALNNGKLGAAALDVTSNEPPARDDLIWELSRHKNVIVTPHIAWAADEAMQNLMNQIMAKMAQFIETGQVDDLCLQL
jgi:glycerate dehydrogenase